MSEELCRECELPIKRYKQVVQQDDEVCENCQLAAMGSEEFPDE